MQPNPRNAAFRPTVSRRHRSLRSLRRLPSPRRRHQAAVALGRRRRPLWLAVIGSALALGAGVGNALASTPELLGEAQVDAVVAGRRQSRTSVPIGYTDPTDQLLDQWRQRCRAAVDLFAGYGNGLLPWDQLVPVSWAPDHVLHPAATAALERLNAEFVIAFGRNLAITSSYRSFAGQIAAQERHGALAADPGTSNHGWGIAVDLGGGIQLFDAPEHLWMRQHAPAFGFILPPWADEHGGLPEPWHWEYHGTPAPGKDRPAFLSVLQDVSGSVEITPQVWREVCG